MANAPDFSAGLNGSDFQTQNSASSSASLDAANKGFQGINYDWSEVHGLLAQLAAGTARSDSQAAGNNLTAGTTARMGQQDLGANTGSSASLGKALMQLGSKASAAQASQVSSADKQQQLEAAKQSTAMRQAAAATAMSMHKHELALASSKSNMARTVKQAQSGLELANLTLRNMYNDGVANARTAAELGTIQSNTDQFTNTMAYVGTSLGAASQAAAGTAQSLAANDAQAAAVQRSSDAALASWYNSSTLAGYNAQNNMTPATGTAASTAPSYAPNLGEVP